MPVCIPRVNKVIESKDLLFRAILSDKSLWGYSHISDGELSLYEVYSGCIAMILDSDEFNRLFKKMGRGDI